MAKIAILCEKPSQARAWAKALGLNGLSGRVGGDEVLVSPAHGFVYADAANEDGRPAPHLMVPASKRDAYRSWSLDNLPWNAADLDFSVRPAHGESTWCEHDRAQLEAYDELVLGGDMDPVAEGDTGFLIEAQRVVAGGFEASKRICVAEFVNESPAAMRTAFERRERIDDLTGDRRYVGPEFRTRFDFLSMQFSRIAKGVSGASLTPRQGRLKSAITFLVGSQWDKVNAYRKVPGYVNRFRDDNGVVYTSPDERVWPHKADVPGSFHDSKVVEDCRDARVSAPPQLLDLAALGARLSVGGVRPGDVLATYQRMYEAGVVSYPRTEDRKLVGREQYDELIANADRIARAVGVDPALLVHRGIRPTHMQQAGAHGPNRPGPNVPSSLDEVESRFGRTGALIYETLARAALALLADDYHYTAVKGHVADHPSFVGGVNVPGAPGWKAVFDEREADDGAPDESAPKGLGRLASPFVATQYPPKPSRPTVTWIKNQLERRSVGTGATRLSTLDEVCKGRTALLSERRGVLRLTEVGEVSYKLLPGTHIGDVGATEHVYALMGEAMAGKVGYEALDVVADWVREDLVTMRANAERAGMRPAKRAARVGDGVRFKPEFNGHTFTDDEVAALSRGEEITFETISRVSGKPKRVTGRLKRMSFTKGRETVRFVGFMASTTADYTKAKDYAPGN